MRGYASDDGSVIRAIEQFWREHDYSPTLRELMEMTGIQSTATMQARLNALRRDGMIRWVKVGRNTRVLKSLR